MNAEQEPTLPFCRHHAPPADCTEVCQCGHRCTDHIQRAEESEDEDFGTIVHTGACQADGCDCVGWVHPENAYATMSAEEREAIRANNLAKLVK